jgi:hypothetical protein
MKKSVISLLAFMLVQSAFAFPVRSDVELLMNMMSSVKSQKSRGTCTIFSTIGLIEALFKIHREEDYDFSEEFLQYTVMSRQMDEGSTVNRNMKKLLFFGLPFEETWPYLGEKWRDWEANELARERCSHLIGDDRPLPPLKSSSYPQNIFGSCLLGHRDPYLLRESDTYVESIDPEFIPIRNEAKLNREELLNGFIVRKKSYLFETNEEVIKNHLSSGTPLIMGIKLFYGAWNHSKTEKFEIQKRDKSLWYRGIVGHPVEGSRDRLISGERGGGHSLVIVGYDDEVEVKSRMLMEDGTWKETIHRGVYYFKNSWGVRGSGRDFTYNGKAYPGFGMMTQDYAHEFGKFYHIPVKN